MLLAPLTSVASAVVNLIRLELCVRMLACGVYSFNVIRKTVSSGIVLEVAEEKVFVTTTRFK